jgi:hypothetical protein
MAIIYSYPLADEVTNDSWVLGSEMDNGLRVVKNYSMGDIFSFIQEQLPLPTLQSVTDEGDITTNDITANTFSTQGAKVWDDGTIEGSSFQFSSLLGSLQSAAQDNKAWLLPDESGTIALTKYKVYTALLTQSGLSNPVATVLENTIGPITITRGGTGEYTITSSGLFTLNQTTFDITPIQGFIKQSGLSSINTIVFETRSTSNVASDGLLVSKKLEIRVYN